MVPPITTDHLKDIGLDTHIMGASTESNTLEPKNWPAAKVRKTFVDFFVQKKSHTHVPSSPVVPHNDPTLLFINAGMNQFKPIFLGQIDPSHKWSTMKSAANSQKCIRAGGKHNDLEDVGFDVYHHTFFEMMGTWSFGDYFKQEAIDWAWELLTEVYKLPKDRLYATYFDGTLGKGPNPGADSGVKPDYEARDMWLKYLPANKVIPSGMKDNFWEMGETGPCGPCSELHYDRIGGRDAAALVNQDDPDVLEIWNLVFMQFNREKDGSLKTLPKPCIDTGMGLERVISCLQDVRSNYDTDAFGCYFKAIKDLCSTKEWECPTYSGLVGKDDVDGIDMAYRVIADHIRTLTIALSDGAIPSAKGRGSVLRLILRRACRYGRRFLRAPDGFFHKLVPVVIDAMGEAYPDLKENWKDVQALIKEEEEQFLRTLDKGEAHFKRIADSLPAGTKLFPGNDIFLLASTYGFPVELTEVMARERGMELDQEGYKTKMEEFQAASRKKKNDTGKEIKLEANETYELEEVRKIPFTLDKAKYDWDSKQGKGETMEVKVLAIWDGKNYIDSGKPEDEELGVIFDKTPAYAESGGQIADWGVVKGDGVSFDFTMAKAYKGYIVHTGKVEFGQLKVGSTVTIDVNYERRQHVARNHTCTHLMNWALREVLGDNVDQQGSSVKEDTFYFDFNANSKLEDKQLAEVERLVNEYISRDETVYTEECDKDSAARINGLRAMFSDKYGAKVRVVSCGQNINEMIATPQEQRFRKYSVEFCGGTHVSKMAEIYRFVILSEEPISKGIRRITACTGAGAASQAQLRQREITVELDEAAGLSGVSLDQKISYLRQKLGEDSSLALLFKRKALKDADTLKEKSLKASKGDAKKLLEVAKTAATEVTLESLTANGKTAKLGVFTAPESLNADMKAVGSAMEVLVKRFPDLGFVILAPSTSEDKMATVAQVPKALSTEINAKVILDAIWKICPGKGGGNAMKAQGTATGIEGKLETCINVAREAVLN